MKASTAPLLMAYAMMSVSAIRVAPEEMLMIRPPSRSRSSPRCVRKNGARMVTATASSNASAVVRSISPRGVMPALLTRMSRPAPPECSRIPRS